MMSNSVQPTETPNIGVIPDPTIRFRVALVLYTVAIAATVFDIVAVDTVIEVSAQPWVDKVLDAVALLGLAFGIGVQTPNTPRR